jgi:hypothetical protein
MRQLIQQIPPAGAGGITESFVAFIFPTTINLICGERPW